MNEKEDLILNYLNEEISDIPIIVHNNLIRNNVKINSRSELEEIKQYIDDFLNEHTSNRFIALPGIRGVGKTTLLYETYHYLIKEKNVPPNNILYFSCDELNKMVNSNIKETIDIYLKKKHDTKLSILNKQIFILIDEAHYDKNWALSGKIIYDKTKNIFMIFTGSSSLELESNTDASRRMNKEVIKPLNYGEHLRLKYNITSGAISESLQKLVFEGNETDAIIEEEKINSKVINSLEYTSNDWELYLKYGGFPVLFDEINMLKLKNKMVDMINKVVTEDIGHLKNISEENKINAQRILRTLALQKSNELSQNKLSKQLQTSSANVKLILNLLEKTQLIFHCESYGTSSNKSNKVWKYYFATSSLKYVLSSQIGNPERDTNEFEGVLLENLVASTLFNTYQNRENYFSIFYDGHRRGNVDFILDNGLKKAIPVEVGRGKKDKKQIKNALNEYNSEYGIIVSNSTQQIEKINDVIYIPFRTFALL